MTAVQIVGFEGDGPGCPVTFGTAAFRIGDSVLNPITRSLTSTDRWRELVDEGFVAAVGPLDLPDEKASATDGPCMLMRFEVPEEATPDSFRTLRASAVHSWKDGLATYLLMPSFEALMKACKPVVSMMRRSAHPVALDAARTLDVVLFKEHGL